MSKLKDIKGLRFGRLIVFEKNPSLKRKTYWKCLCDCGNITSVRTDHLRTSKIQSCGCLRVDTGELNLKDVLGQKFGKLTVVSRADNIREKAMWNCKCDCGNDYIANSWALGNGRTTHCGCNKLTAEQIAINRIYSTYKHSAQERGFSFQLNKESFKYLLQQPCFYCGGELSNVYRDKFKGGSFTYQYNGIDRKNNDIGYLEENVVSCCSICNRMKLHHSEELFYSHIKKIINYKKL